MKTEFTEEQIEKLMMDRMASKNNLDLMVGAVSGMVETVQSVMAALVILKHQIAEKTGYKISEAPRSTITSPLRTTPSPRGHRWS